jgi:uncharacterized protein (TIGR03435 family)
MLRSAITPGGNLRTENVAIRTLIEDAYQLKPFQLGSGPKWIDDEKFEVLARGSKAATTEQVRLMLQALLEDRFHLVLKRESREQTISYLMVKDQQKLKLIPSREGAPSTADTTARRDGLNHVTFTGTTMARLADVLARQMERVVVDRTGLNGPFDFELDAAHDDGETNPFIAPYAPALGQIGLQLETTKGPVDFFTIERVERPSAN